MGKGKHALKHLRGSDKGGQREGKQQVDAVATIKFAHSGLILYVHTESEICGTVQACNMASRLVFILVDKVTNRLEKVFRCVQEKKMRTKHPQANAGIRHHAPVPISLFSSCHADVRRSCPTPSCGPVLP